MRIAIPLTFLASTAVSAGAVVLPTKYPDTTDSLLASAHALVGNFTETPDKVVPFLLLGVGALLLWTLVKSAKATGRMLVSYDRRTETLSSWRDTWKKFTASYNQQSGLGNRGKLPKKARNVELELVRLETAGERRTEKYTALAQEYSKLRFDYVLGTLIPNVRRKLEYDYAVERNPARLRIWGDSLTRLAKVERDLREYRSEDLLARCLA